MAANSRDLGVRRSLWLYKQCGPFLQNMGVVFARPTLHAVALAVLADLGVRLRAPALALDQLEVVVGRVPEVLGSDKR